MINGTYLNGVINLDIVRKMKFKNKQAIHKYIAQKGGAFVFEEAGEKKVIRSDDIRGERSLLLGKLFQEV